MTLRDENKISEKVSKSNTLWAYAGNLDAKATGREVWRIVDNLDLEPERDFGEYVAQAYCDGMGTHLSGDNYSVALMDAVEEQAQQWSDEAQQDIYGRNDGWYQYDEDQEIGRGWR